MKQVFAALLLFPALSFAQGFTVTGSITGLADGKVKIASTQDTNQVLASGLSKQGAFVLKGNVAEPGLYWLMMTGEQPRYLYLENSPIKISGTKKTIKDLKVTGSSSHTDFEQFQGTFQTLIAELNATAAQLQQQGPEERRVKIMAHYDQLVDSINRQVDRFVSAKRNSFVSPFVLYITAQLNRNPLKLEENFNLLSESIRNSTIGKSLGEYIAYSKVGAVGTNALEFTQNDTAGRPVSLSSFRGKYVLVDFWASWCRPCRAENPNVVKAYNKFKAKNFTILGISLDQEREAWIKAIEKDKLTWTQLSDLQQWNNAVAQMYRVQSIPQNMLIDPDGRIIAKDLRGEDLEKKLCELLGCEASTQKN